MLAKGIPNRGTLQDSNLQELYDWAPDVLDRLKRLPEAA